MATYIASKAAGEAADVATETDRLVGLGARVLANVEEWVVLADPEGGEFCVQPARLPDPADRPNRA
jgi:hypothetical protein